jgi:hypothetical protein
VRLQNPRDRRSPDLVANVLERTLNAGVAPRRIVLGHAQGELPDLGQNTTTAGFLLRIRPLARATSCRCQRNTVSGVTIVARSRNAARPSLWATHGESPPVIVSKRRPPSTELLPEEAILFDKIGERLPFPAIQPSGDA